MSIPTNELVAVAPLSLKEIEKQIIKKQKMAFEQIRRSLSLINLVLLKESDLYSWFFDRLRASPGRLPLALSLINAYRRQVMSIGLMGHNLDDARRISFRLSMAPDDSRMIQACIAMERFVFPNNDVKEFHWAKILIDHKHPQPPRIEENNSFHPDSYWLTLMCEAMQDEDSVKKVLNNFMKNQIQSIKDHGDFG